jgi:hypothetical protein
MMIRLVFIEYYDNRDGFFCKFFMLFYNTSVKKSETTRILLSPIIELSMIIGVFFLAYKIRSITDGILFVQLRIPYISYEQFVPFIISGVILWGVIFSLT